MDLKKFINDYKLSQRELAELFDCKAPNVSRIVNEERPLTRLQIRLLIDKYGREAVSKYAEPEEMPSSTINIDMHKESFKDINAPVQNGDGNNISIDHELILSLKIKDEQINKLLEDQSRKNDQMDRLISILEDLTKK